MNNNDQEMISNSFFSKRVTDAVLIFRLMVIIRREK